MGRNRLVVIFLFNIFASNAWSVDNCDMFRFVCNSVRDSVVWNHAKFDKIWVESRVYYDYYSCQSIFTDLIDVLPCEFDNHFVLENNRLIDYYTEAGLEWDDEVNPSNHYPYLMLRVLDIDVESIYIEVLFKPTPYYTYKFYFKLKVKDDEIILESCVKKFYD